MFFLLFYIIILFTKQSDATSNSPGSASSASGSSDGTYIDYYGGVSSTSGNAAPTSSSGALSSDLLSSLKLDHQFTQSTPSDSYDQVYPEILKKYTKSTNKCQPKIIIRHKIKKIHVPYPVEKKVPVYKEVKIPIKVPVKVPVYIPVKYTEEKITSYQPVDNKYDDGQQAPNSQLEFDDPSPGPYQDVSYEYPKSQQPQNPSSPKYQLNFGSYQDPAPDPPPTKFVKISPSISNKFSEVSYDGQQQQQYTPEPEVHPKIPYNYGFPKLSSQSNSQPPSPPSKYQFEYSPPIPMPQPTAPVVPSGFGFKNLDALLASKLSALSGGNEFGGNQGMQQTYSMDPTVYSPQDYYPSASMTYSMKKLNRKSKSSDPAQMEPQAMDPNTAYNMFGFGSMDSDTSYLDSTLFTGTGLDRTSEVFTTVIASYQDVPYSVQPVIETSIPEPIYPKPLNSEAFAPYSETTTYDNNQVINDISKFSIEDSAKPSKPYNSYPSYDPYDSYHSHSHYHPCPKVRKIEKIVYKIKKVKVPVPMIVKKNVYPIKVMLPYRKKRYPKKYKKKAVIIIKGKIKYGKKKKKYYDEEYYDNPTAHAEISDESDKPETAVENPTKSLNPWDPKAQDPAQFDDSEAKKEKDDKAYWNQKYEQTLKEFDFDLNNDSVRK